MDLEKLHATIFDGDSYGGGARIEAVLDEFFQSRGRSVYNLHQEVSKRSSGPLLLHTSPAAMRLMTDCSSLRIGCGPGEGDGDLPCVDIVAMVVVGVRLHASCG